MKNCQSLSVAVLLILIFVTGCSSLPPVAVSNMTTAAPDQVTLKVFAPSSMTDAVKELAAAFGTANPGVKLAIEIGHSPTQRLQLTQGAVGDVFITASQRDMDDAVTDGSVDAGAAHIFAMNRLTVVLPPENPADIQQLADLATEGVRLLVAVSDTPIGKVTLTSLDKMEQQFGAGFKDKVLANVVSHEAGVKPIVAKLQLSEADAGVVFVTDAVAAPKLRTLEIPPDVNVISQLNIAPLAEAPHGDRAAAFVAFVTSAEGQAILNKWGFLPGKS